MTRKVILCLIPLLLGTYFDTTLSQECDDPCTARSCSPPYYGTCCQKENITGGSSHTNQSSMYREYGRYFPSDLAVDGNTNTDFMNFSCTHTDDLDERDAYWMINLQSTYNISEIKLYLRSNIAQRYNGLKVLVGSTECYRLNKTFTSHPTPPEDQIQHIHCRPPLPGSLVSVHIDIGMLTLCEVQIFACKPGWYGEECERRCNCRDSAQCDQRTGWCRGGCRAGKQGDGCQCDCADGRYGLECRESCGHCMEGAVCDKTNGTCHSGCEQGYIGALCQECDELYHESGDSCEACGLCENSEPCNVTTGLCAGNCQAGYQQRFCKDECDEGWFGTSCLSQCGKCLGDQSCDKTDGTCTDGCVEHFTPPICTECVDGMYGVNCNSTCGRCLEDSPCNKTTGVCHIGCSSWFEPPVCHHCFPGRYGPHCESTCGQCADNATCSRNGTCPRGCLAGFTDGLCQTMAIDNSPTVALIVGGVFAVLLFLLIVVAIVRSCHGRKLKMKTTTTVACTNENQTDTSFIDVSDGNEAASKRLDDKQKQKDIPSKKVTINVIIRPKLATYIKDRVNGDGFDNEFKLLPFGIHDTHDEGKKPENKKRNRFLELYPYDHSRVVLKPEVDAYNDYINASYINADRATRTYIAAQGPNPDTVNDFWRMIWQERVSQVVMVTRLMELTKKKCEQYWPDNNETIECGHIRVHHEYSTVRRDYTIRTFKVQHAVHASESRVVTQLHFTAWPDHDVTSAPALVSFWKQFRNLHQEQDTGLVVVHCNGGSVGLYQEKDTRPVVVHCSTGMGRTGTFIGLELLFEEAEREKRVNVFSCVHQMRKARMNMVQTADQYGFLYEVVQEAIRSKNTLYTSTEFNLKFGTGKIFTGDHQKEIQREFETLNTLRKSFKDKQVSEARLPENVPKNRDQNIVPENRSKPYLTTALKSRNQYINAVFLPSYVRHSALIATQTPLPDTVVDSWRLVYDHDIVNIVCLEDYEMVYPSKDAPVESGPFQICLEKWERKSSFTQTQIGLTKLEEPKASRKITVYKPVCTRPSDLLECVNEMEMRGVFKQGQLLVHCHNGSDLCGLFCGVLNIITRLRLDREVDIFLDIRELQSIRPSFINTVDQYRFCYEAVKEYQRSSTICENV